MKRLILCSIIVFVCNVIVLITVWRHAHWSVALLLSILIARLEVSELVEDKQRYEDRLLGARR